jgi:adenylate cyclase
LLEVSKQLSSPEEPNHLLEKILDLLLEITTIDRAVILMINEATGQLERKAVKSRSGVPFDYQFYSKRILNCVCNNGEAILTADACIDQRFNDAESILKHPIHASMCVPLKPREAVIGVLYVDNLSISGVYADEDVEFLTALANQAAIAIENSQLYKKMQAEAVLRDKLERFFPEAVSRKLREEGNLAIVDTEVTALFSDISGFTKMSSTMEPRQIIEMLNDYFQVMVEDIVFRYEGTLEKYIGDALLAVWGAPYQKADDVDRAVRAAIDMQWAVRHLNQEWQQQRNQQIQIHIGLNTGKVAAGNIGSKKLIQYATIGDTTNVTSRICGVAKAGEILISQSTYDKLSDRMLPLEKMQPVKVKGKEQPLQLYRVLWNQVRSATTPSPP